MKYIRSIFAGVAGLLALAACQDLENELGKTISVDKPTLQFAGVSAPAQTITVTCDGDWLSSAPDWIIVEPSFGSGKTDVKVSVLDNVDDVYRDEVAGPRSGVIVFGGLESITVAVSQSGESGLDATRRYTRITSASEFDPTKNYLLVTEVDDTFLAADNMATPWTEGKYYYWSAVKEVEDEDGVITRPNGSLGFSFEPAATEGSYYLVQPNGTYVYQSAGYYTSFYCTTDVTKAQAWTVSFDQDGSAVLVNTAMGDANYFFQFTKGQYTEWITATSLGETEHPVYLYMDSAIASDEVLSAPESVSVSARATSASIAVSANKSWKVRCHDEWIKSFTRSGEGDGTIEVEFDANASTTDSRSASFLIIGESTNVTVTLEQGAIATTVAGIVAQITSTSSSNPSAVYAELGGAVVSYKSGSNVYIEDNTGAVLLYSSSAGLEEGDAISGVIEGSGYLYSGLAELTTIGTKFSKTAGATVPETEMTIANLLNDFNANVSRRIKLVDVEVSDAFGGDDRDGELTQGESKIALRSQAKGYAAQSAGTKGDVVIFPAIYNGNKRLSYYDGLFTVTLIGGSIACNDVTVGVSATVNLNAKPNIDGVTLSYVSEDESIATVNADGVVTGVKVGVTNVTISFPAGEGYSAASKTVKVTVSNATPSGYTKVKTALTDYSGTYLLVNDEAGKVFTGFSGTIGAVADVTVSNGVIAFSSTLSAYEITINKATVTSGAYVIKFGSKFFSWASGNSLISADAETAAENWNISLASGGEITITNVATPARVLSYNAGSPRFACYGNTNQKRVHLYKK